VCNSCAVQSVPVLLTVHVVRCGYESQQSRRLQPLRRRRVPRRSTAKTFPASNRRRTSSARRSIAATTPGSKRLSVADDRGASSLTTHGNPQGPSRGAGTSPAVVNNAHNTHFVELQVTKLMGHEPLTKWIVLFVVALQLLVAFALRSTNPHSPLFIFLAYAIGGTANHNLFLAIHEITHNLAFKGIKANKFLAMFANLPISIPYAVTFKVCDTTLLYYHSTERFLEIPPRTPQAARRGWCGH